MKSTYLFLALLLSLCTSCASTLSNRLFVDNDSRVLPGELRAQYFGTSTIAIGDGNHTILIDGFFTRMSVLKRIFARMKSNEETVENTLRVANITTVDSIFVGHAHFDHVLDVTTIANFSGAKVFGSETVLKHVNWEHKSKLFDGKQSPSGPFIITSYKTPHVPKSRFALAIEHTLSLIMGGQRFDEAGDTYSFFIQHPQSNILVIPSADFGPNIQLPAKADIVFMSVGLLSNQPQKFLDEYWHNAVTKTCARYVIPTHWDDFRIPLFEELQSPPRIIDDINSTLDHLSRLARQPNCEGQPVKVLLPKSTIAFTLNRVTQQKGF